MDAMYIGFFVIPFTKKTKSNWSFFCYQISPFSKRITHYMWLWYFTFTHILLQYILMPRKKYTISSVIIVNSCVLCNKWTCAKRKIVPNWMNIYWYITDAGLWFFIMFLVLSHSDAGILFGWGGAAEGQLGMGDTTECTIPREVPVSGRVKQVSCGYYHTAFVTGER